MSGQKTKLFSGGHKQNNIIVSRSRRRRRNGRNNTSGRGTCEITFCGRNGLPGHVLDSQTATGQVLDPWTATGQVCPGLISHWTSPGLLDSLWTGLVGTKFRLFVKSYTLWVQSLCAILQSDDKILNHLIWIKLKSSVKNNKQSHVHKKQCLA